jgi:predicted amidohydrolase YtcJ
MTTSAADLIVVADRIHTLDPENPAAQVIAMRDGRIVGVGDRADAHTWRGAATEVIDLGGATVTPGLVDGHIHPMLGLNLTQGVDLSTVTSLDELTLALRTERATNPQGWLRGWGLNPNIFGSAELTSAPIVEAVGDIPALIILFDAHSAIATPAALHLADITGRRDFDGKAEIACNEDGTPTGYLVEIPAYDLVRAVIPQPTLANLRTRLKSLLDAMAATGLTAGNAMDFDGRSDELITSLAAETTLPLRLRFAPMCMPGSTRDFYDHIIDLQHLRGARWQVEGVKFMIDGTIDGGTAWLEHPDSHGESAAPFWPDPLEYHEAVRYLAAAGVPTVTHAIGDAGVKYVLDALSSIPSARTNTTRVPHRIEHIETIPAALVGRFRELDVTASMQPTHCTLYTRADHTDNWSERLGTTRANRAFCTRDLRDSGARVALGSDWPVAPFDARGVIADAQLRRPHGHPDIDAVLPDQALTARMALEGYTTHAAAAAGLAEVSGRLTVGRRADLSAFVLDPLTAPPDEFAESPVPLTVVDGAVAHRADH